MKRSRAENEALIKAAEEAIKDEPKYTKRWVFLASVINGTRKEIGKPELKKYTW